MNIKNIFLTLGICCTAVGGALNVKPKLTTPVYASSESFAETVQMRIDNGDGKQAWLYMSTYNGAENVRGTAYRIYYQNETSTELTKQYVTTIIDIANGNTTNYINTKIQTNNKFNGRLDVYSEQKFIIQNPTNALGNEIITAFADNDINGFEPNQIFTDYDGEYFNWQPFETIALKPLEINQRYIYVHTILADTEDNFYYTSSYTKPDNPYTQTAVIGGVELQNQIVTEQGTEVIDIGGLMIRIVSLPFTFISTAFNLTLFPNTPYQVNIGNFILGLVAILTILFIIKIFTGGLDIIGNVTNSARNNATERIRLNTAKQKSKRQNTAAKNANKKAKGE